MKQKNNSVKELEIPIYFHNYKLLQDKEFVLKGSNIYFIQGPNKVGKTSFLKALQSLMIANDDTPDKVTRGSGEAEGHYEATIPAADGTLITIHHEFTDDGKGKFYAVDSEGNKISQVTEIRRLFNYTPINVNEFFAWSNSAEGRRKQRDVILKLLSDTDRKAFNDLDLQEQHYYEQRTGINKLVEQAENSIHAIIINPEDEKLIPREKEAKDLITLYKSVQNARTLMPEKEKSVTDIDERKVKLEAEIKAKQAELEELKSKRVIAENAVGDLKKITTKYDKLSDEELATKLSTGETIITKITSLETKTTLKKEWQVKLDENKNKSEELTTKIGSCRDAKADIVSGSDLPVENIDFEDGYLTIDGFQFKENQICESDAVLILANILARINPGPIQIIGDASVLDAEKLDVLNKIAEDNNKVMFVDEVIRTSTEMVVVGYEDLRKEDLERNFEKLDGKKSKKESKAKKPAKEKDLTEPSANDTKEPLPGTEESDEPETLF
jgi:energy-coupling factor transporter ATP-binding protein EcfA2